MATERRPGTLSRSHGWWACGLVMALTAGVALAIHLPHALHTDVAYLAWIADKVMRGSVFGRDVYEINPPLSFMIYWPATLLAPVTGHDLAIKLWVSALAAVSIASLWQTAERHIRLPVILALGLYVVLALPAEFGQREQMALLLCAPYVAGNADRRGLALLNGVMAGIGFALKPYFLIPLLLVFASRRRIRTEERAIVLVGLCYAAVVLLFFRPYLTEMLPRLLPIYWSNNVPLDAILTILSAVPLIVFPMWLVAAPQRGTIGFSLAALGFAAAVAIHHKGFAYQFITCFGFLTIYLAALLRNERAFARWLAGICLAIVAVILSAFGYYSLQFIAQRDEVVPPLLAEVNRAESFIFLSDDNFGAFPTAILTQTPYLGLAPANIYMASVLRLERNPAAGDVRPLRDLALEQTLRELGREPELVIVLKDWAPKAGLAGPVDGLAWFNQDPRFRALWSDYVETGETGRFRFFRRK